MSDAESNSGNEVVATILNFGTGRMQIIQGKHTDSHAPKTFITKDTLIGLNKAAAVEPQLEPEASPTPSVKPPLGVKPHWAWFEHMVQERRQELQAAILRYIQANRPVNPLWMEEYNQLTVGHWPVELPK